MPAGAVGQGGGASRHGRRWPGAAVRSCLEYGLLVHAAEAGAQHVLVDVPGEEIPGRVGVGLGLLHNPVDLLLDRLLDLLEVRRLHADLQRQDELPHALDGVPLLAGGGHLVAGAVGAAGVGHGVAVVAVGVHLQDDGAVVHGVLLGEGGGLLHRQHVHAVHLEAGHVVSAGVEGGGLGAAPLSGAHAVMVVLAHKDDGQVPQARNVERLVLLALVGRAIAVHGERNVPLLHVLVLEGQAGAERDLRAHDAAAAVEVVLLLVHVHRAADALGRAGVAPEELRYDLVHGAAAPDVRAVVAVRGDDGVLVGDGGLHALDDGLLPVVQVTEAADELGLVRHVGGDLHTPHAIHVLEKVQQLRFVGCHRPRGGLDLVALEGCRDLNGDVVGVRSGGHPAADTARRERGRHAACTAQHGDP
mmetsp:Transcript_22786/g.58407  ORF Transcript_22786/g.58407 Transcript_22786/m.58407 type:complete len:416 (+) Transcript_22786:91-1338(+)